MNIKNLGESGKLAIYYSEEASRQLHNNEIRPEHLFLGIAELGDVNIKNQFSRVGLEIEELCHKIRQAIRNEAKPDSVEITFQAATKELILASRLVASVLGQETIEAPHILLTLLNNKNNLVYRFINDGKANREKLIKNIEAMVRSEEWPKKFYSDRKVVEQPGIDKSASVLKNLGRNLTAYAQDGKLDPIIGRENEILGMMKILSSRRKSNPILVGDAGVGKTAIVEGLAQVICSGAVPPELRGKTIHTVEMVAVISAGAKYFGVLEQKLEALVKTAEEDPNLIIFIDEIHTLMQTRGGTINAADILKPALARGKIKCIGATTTQEFRKHIEKDSALERRFQPIFVGESSPDDTMDILWGLRSKYESFHGLKILDEALSAAVELSNRYIVNRCLPDKAIDLLDQACSHKKLRFHYGLDDLRLISREEKKYLFTKYQDLTASKSAIMITREDVARVVAEWTGIPSGKLTEEESKKLLELESLIKKRIVGQDNAVQAIARSIRKSRSGLGDAKRPIGSFLFLGPTGVGKTELAKTLAEVLFDDEEYIIQIDMSEFYEKHTISRLIGSPHGYVDSDLGGQLTEAVKKQPYSVVLFDEVEKAHPEVMRILLQAMEEGRITDGLGRMVNFKNTVMIMTSNLGSQLISDYRPIGFDLHAKKGTESIASELQEEIYKELKKKFSPEFVNRLDDVIIFDPLSRENLLSIAERMLGKIKIKVEADQKAIEFLVNAGYDPAMGARPLRRAIESMVIEPLANDLIEGKISEYDVVQLRVADEKLVLSKKKDKSKKKPPKVKEVDREKNKSKQAPGQDNNGNQGEKGSAKGDSAKICPGYDCKQSNPPENKWCDKCGRNLNKGRT